MVPRSARSAERAREIIAHVSRGLQPDAPAEVRLGQRFWPVWRCFSPPRLNRRAKIRLRGRLPQLDAIAFGVRDPAETAVLGVLALGIDVRPRGPQRFQYPVQVIDDVVDHDRLRTAAEIVAGAGEQGPNGR